MNKLSPGSSGLQSSFGWGCQGCKGVVVLCAMRKQGPRAVPVGRWKCPGSTGSTQPDFWVLALRLSPLLCHRERTHYCQQEISYGMNTASMFLILWLSKEWTLCHFLLEKRIPFKKETDISRRKLLWCPCSTRSSSSVLSKLYIFCFSIE